jgi:ribosome biogenesis GTPase A
MDIQWYPGHMTRARRQMQEDLKLIDLIIELVDARVPGSSRNPDIDELGRQKARLVLLNKADLADEEKNRKWMKYWQGKGYSVLLADSRNRASLRQIQPMVAEACREKLERDARKGIRNRPVRAMVAGIPNVGKSTFINSYAGKACTKTGNKPGVTRGKQWIRMGKGLELLDTPGILWPRFEDPEVGKRLALIGSVRDEILNGEELALELISFLTREYPGVLAERYRVEEDRSAAELLACIAENRKCLTKGGGIFTEKAAAILLDDFRSGKLGRITLELPPGEEKDENPE